MTFFERYFAALDGPDPHSSLQLVADDAEFTIQWADGADADSRQFVGGREDLRRFIDAGDMRDWAHHVLSGGTAGDVEFALGETRYDDGTRIGTFLAVAQLDADGRMVKYMVARSPAIAFDSGDRVDAAAE
jgi:ketosteroid isomerase-like protein